MIGKNYKYNGTSISKVDAEYRIWLTDWNPLSVDVTDEQNNIQGTHWIKLSPTYARGRRIVIEWLIIADTKVGSSKWISYLQNLFALQGITDNTEFKPFTFTDEQDNTWELDAKVKEPLELELEDNDWQEWANRRFRVVLQGADPRFYSSQTQTVQWLEWYYWWVKLGTKLWTKLDDYFNEMRIVANWNIESPLKITITALRDITPPLLIKNYTTDTFFWLDVSWTAWDVFVIDAKNFTATKNGVNTLANRIEWSIWQKVKWENVIWITDFDWWLYASDFDVSVQYRDVLL